MRAQAPKCNGILDKRCTADAVTMNSYSLDGYPCWSYWCASCESVSHDEYDGLHLYDYDRYEPLLLAEVGDELWLSLECWMHEMHRLVNP